MSKSTPGIEEIRNEAALKAKRSKRRRIWLGSLAGFFVLLVAFGFWGLPPILKGKAQAILSEMLGREVVIGRVRVNPLTLRLGVEGFAIKEADGSVFVGWRRLSVNFDSWSFIASEWRFQDIELDGFEGHVAIATDGRLNFQDIVDRVLPKPETPAPADPAAAPTGMAAWPVRVAKLTVNETQVKFEDHSRGQPFATVFGPVSFSLDGFTTRPVENSPYRFHAKTESGEEFLWEGTVGMSPVRSSGHVELNGIKPAKYAAYHALFHGADILSGSVDVGADYELIVGEGAPVARMSHGLVHVKELALAVRGEKTPVITLPLLSIDGMSVDLAGPTGRIEKISVAGGDVHVIRDENGGLNLLKLAASQGAGNASPAAAPVATPSPAATVALPAFSLGQLSVSGFSITAEDHTLPHVAINRIDDLGLTLGEADLTKPDAAWPLSLAFKIAPGGTFAIEGTVTPFAERAALKLTIDKLPVAGARPYLEPMANLTFAAGTVSAALSLTYDAGVATIAGDASLDNWQMVTGSEAIDLVRWKRLAFTGLKAGTQPLAMHLDAITFDEPRMLLTMDADGVSNFQKLLPAGATPVVATEEESEKKAPAPAGAAYVGSTPMPDWSLGEFVIMNARMDVADESVKPRVRMEVTGFNGKISGLSSAAPDRADLAFAGKVDSAGTISINGKLDARSVRKDVDAKSEVTLRVANVDLGPTSPYSSTYAGYALARGGLNISVGVELQRRKIVSENVITLEQFSFGQATPNPLATKLPVRLAVALLKDTDGRIIIDVPVAGELDDPSFKIGRVVFRVIVNLLTKAAVSPFSLLGAAFGGGGDELAWQSFPAGGIAPLDSEIQKLDTLKKALGNRPALTLEITGGYEPTGDTAALRAAGLDRRLRALRWEELHAVDPATPPPEEVVMDDETVLRLVTKLYETRFPVDANAAMTPPKAEVFVQSDIVAPPPAALTQSQPEYRRVVGAGGRVLRVVNRSVTPAPTKPERASDAKVPTPAADAQTSDGAAPVAAQLALPSLAVMRTLLEAEIAVSEDELAELGRKRAQAVMGKLLEDGQIAPARVILSAGARAFPSPQVQFELH